MYLARVIGRVVASTRYPGFDRVALQWVQPLDEEGRDSGDALVACACVSTGPGDLVQFVDGREAALACPDETFVPIDASIVGYVEQAYANGRFLGREEPAETGAGVAPRAPAGARPSAPSGGRGPGGSTGAGGSAGSPGSAKPGAPRPSPGTKPRPRKESR